MGSKLVCRGIELPPFGVMENLPDLVALSGSSVDLAVRSTQGGMSRGYRDIGRCGRPHPGRCLAVPGVLEEKDKKPAGVQEVRGLVEVSAKAAQLGWQIEGRSPEGVLLLAHMARQLEMKLNEQRMTAREDLRKLVPRIGKAKVVKWPTRLERRLQQTGDDQNLRAKAEKDERARGCWS